MKFVPKGLLVAFAFVCLATLHAHEAIDDMTEDARAFLDSLSPSLREKAVQEFSSDYRLNWHYVPRERQGVAMKELTKKQQQLVYGLLDSALSQKGLVKTTGIITVEEVLHQLENKSPLRDPGAYHIIIFGTPDQRGTWGWRFEGHHLSINMTMIEGNWVTGTPMFLGANPATVKSGPKKGMRTLAAEEDLGRKLINALDDDQRRTAIISETAPREIITRASRQVKPLEPAGISFAEMNRQQGELLLDLIREYIFRYRNEIADADWKKIREAGWDNIHFAWAGSLEPGQGHYYRVQGPTFLLEYDNTQNDANHIHTVWRDFDNDFGIDLLKEHYHREPHGK